MVMALRASQGDLSLLLWGADYGGAVLTGFEAPLIAVFGFRSVVFTVVDTRKAGDRSSVGP